MNEVIIRILDSSNSVLGDLDLKSFNDFPLVITKGIVNLDNLKARTGSYTKSFKVPNTKNNSKLLNSLDDINSRKDYNDALNRKPCAILVDGVEIDKGFLQVSKVYQGFELDSFELVFFGNNVDWVKQASEKDLKDITFNNNSQTYNTAGIVAANAADSDTYDHCYPYVSRSGDKTYKPVYYLRSIIERGLNSIGYNVSSSFLTDAEIKKLVCDFDLKFIVSDTDVSATKLRAELTSGTITTPKFQTYRIVFNDDTNAPNEDSNSNYNAATGVYTVPNDGTYLINYNLNINRGGTTEINYHVQLVKGGTSTTSIGTGQILAEYVATIRFNEPGAIISIPFEQTLTAGDDISLYIYAPDQAINTLNDSYANIFRKQEIEDGDTFTLSEVIPRDIKLLDVINDFTRMFNVYYWTDVKTKTIYFEPRDSFFQSQSNSVDWTDKLDLSNKYEINYVSSYKRSIEFKYRDLSNDAWLKGWQEANKRTYGKYKHTLPDRFAEGKDTISLDLFCASYTQKDDEGNVLDGGVLNSDTSPISIRLWSDYVKDKPAEQIEDYNPKIYQYNYGTQTSLSGLSRKINYNGTQSTTIPYGIFESYENVTSGINLSFTGSDGLFATYYAKMFKNIEEGGRLIAYFNLDNVDIENLDFRKLVYIDYPLEVKGYYLIESVIDYNPIKNGLTKVSLFKFENLGSVAIDTTQQGNNGNEVDLGNEEPTLFPIYVEDGSNLLEVWIENPITGLLEPVYK